MRKTSAEKIVVIAFLGSVSLWVLAAAAQILMQVFGDNGSSVRVETCSGGLATLHTALRRAQEEAESGGTVGEGADVALARFRTALTPEWNDVGAIRRACQASTDRRSLDAIVELRYAEEHAVRREAASLSLLRKQVFEDLRGRGVQ